jgi:hypothetical protein
MNLVYLFFNFYLFISLTIWWITKMVKFQIKIGEVIVTLKIIEIMQLIDLRAIIINILQVIIWISIWSLIIPIMEWRNNIDQMNILLLLQILKIIILLVWWLLRLILVIIIKFRHIWCKIPVMKWNNIKI